MRRTSLLPWILALAFSATLAQKPEAPIPRPRPPEEPLSPPVLEVRVLFGETPLPGILVVLQPMAPNRMPFGKGILRLTDKDGTARFPLTEEATGFLIAFHDRERGLRLQMPLAFALGTWSLGPYRFALSLLPP
ncbi:hypothetical protein [Thermus antranikianii]